MLTCCIRTHFVSKGIKSEFDYMQLCATEALKLQILRNLLVNLVL